jgi:hypothetical protein
MSCQRFCRLLAVPVVAAVLVLVGGGPAMAVTTDSATPARTANVIKPAPVPPANAYHPGTRPTIAPKPHRTHGASPQLAWSLTLTASPSTLWPTQYTTLTAVTNQDVGPTPYYISIYEDSYGNPIVVCASGTTCSISVTQPTPTFMPYFAVVSGLPGVYPPPNEVAWSGTQVTWTGVSLTLSTSATTLPVNGVVTLGATTSQDIGPSPFYIEILDTTSQTVLASCGFGTRCGTTVSQAAATTHRYLAAVASYSGALPPPNLQTLSMPAWVAWTSSDWQVSLVAGPNDTATATANHDVGPTPYYIEIFGEYGDTTPSGGGGSRLASCAYGTTCTVTEPPAGMLLVAFVSAYDSTLPPANIQASSPVIWSPTIVG